jgi:hypothetical protein
MSVLLAGLAVACGSALSALVLRVRHRRILARLPKVDAEQQEAEKAPRPALDLKGLPIERGDVLVFASGDEVWLPGVSAFYEQGADGEQVELALFVGLNAWVLALPAPDSVLFRCESIAIELGPEPPSTIEHNGALYERTRRLPLQAKSEGEDARLEGFFLVGLYRSASGTELCVLVGEHTKRAFVCQRLIPGSYDRYPGRLTLTP